MISLEESFRRLPSSFSRNMSELDTMLDYDIFNVRVATHLLKLDKHERDEEIRKIMYDMPNKQDFDKNLVDSIDGCCTVGLECPQVVSLPRNNTQVLFYEKKLDIHYPYIPYYSIATGGKKHKSLTKDNQNKHHQVYYNLNISSRTKIMPTVLFYHWLFSRDLIKIALC